ISIWKKAQRKWHIIAMTNPVLKLEIINSTRETNFIGDDWCVVAREAALGSKPYHIQFRYDEEIKEALLPGRVLSLRLPTQGNFTHVVIQELDNRHRPLVVRHATVEKIYPGLQS